MAGGNDKDEGFFSGNKLEQLVAARFENGLVPFIFSSQLINIPGDANPLEEAAQSLGFLQYEGGRYIQGAVLPEPSAKRLLLRRGRPGSWVPGAFSRGVIAKVIFHANSDDQA